MFSRQYDETEEFEDEDEVGLDDDLDDDDDEEEEGDEDDDPGTEETAEGLAALERAFHRLRAQVRASSDVVALRAMRAEYLDSLSSPMSPTTRLRTQDVIDLIDERVTDLRAARGGLRSR